MGVTSSVFGKKETKILILGLDASGKTSIMNELRLGIPYPNGPTIGFNRASVNFKNKNYQIWDIGGQYELRQYWKCYFMFTKGLVMVIDASDRERIAEAKMEFDKVVKQSELSKVPILIYANKQDLPNAMKTKEVAEKLGLKALKKRQWHIQPSCATAGLGIQEGMKWLVKNV